MIYLTGDVHSSNLKCWEHEIVGSQIKSAKRYLEILRKYKIPCTLFVNGICLDQEDEEIKELLKFNVELGGHTYDNFGKIGRIRSYVYRKIFRCIYGPEFYQRRDIQKTKRAFEKFGLKMSSWRTHAFGSNEKTFIILKEAEVKVVSDLTGEIKPFERDGIVHLPINIPIDNNTIAYGKIKPENRDPFASCTKGRISPEEWFEILKKRIESNERKRIDSILLIHPVIMAVLDDFALFEKIARFLSKFKCKKVSEMSLTLIHQ